MDNRPIGVYDSGIGGLTGLKALRCLLPGEDFVFFADTGRMPYGPRPQAELCRIAKQDMDFLAGFGVKVILAACGTISSAAHAVLAEYPIPAFGVVDTAIRAMADVAGDGPLGVLATAASIESGQFTDALRTLCPGREVIGLPCPEFAPTIEAGHIDPDDPVLRSAVERALAPVRGVPFSAVLLGCTHYGIIEAAISRALPGIRLLSAADCGAEAVRDYLVSHDLTGGAGETRFYISRDPADFDAFASRYLALGPVRAEQVPIMEL